MATPPDRLSTEQILSAVTHLSLPELEQVFEQVLQIQAERKADHLPAEESRLLVQINIGLSSEARERLAVLRAKREDESITDAEYDELTRLIDEAENTHANRMTALVELARIRGVSLPMLMDRLGIHFPENV